MSVAELEMVLQQCMEEKQKEDDDNLRKEVNELTLDELETMF